MPQTLLLADDSVTIQRVIELTFADEAISVIAVGDGDHAIASIRQSPPDIVLADVGMPGRNGYEVARHIKQTPALAHIPVLLLTGAFEPIDQARAADVGCDGVLTKPFDPHVVIRRVKELLEASRPAPAAIAAAAAPPQAEEQTIAPISTETVARLDDYFERLDQAFAARSVDPPVVAPAAPSLSLQTPHPAHAAASSPLPYSPAPPAAAAEASAPVLAGAFSALLAAEQSGAETEAFADWLPDEPETEPAVSAVPVITDDTIDTIVRRVLDHLSDTVVREAVTAVASATAERLVREEIERIKSNIK